MDGAQITFPSCFLWLPEGSGPRSARAGVVETQFPPFDLPSKTVLSFCQYCSHFCDFECRNSSKRHQKSSLKATSEKLGLFVCSGSTSWTCYGPLLRASETLWPSKDQGFLKPETLDSQKVVSHHVWGPLALQVYRVFSHRRPRAIQKTTIWHACRPKPCCPKEGLSNLT